MKNSKNFLSKAKRCGMVSAITVAAILFSLFLTFSIIKAYESIKYANALERSEEERRSAERKQNAEELINAEERRIAEEIRQVKERIRKTEDSIAEEKYRTEKRKQNEKKLREAEIRRAAARKRQEQERLMILEQFATQKEVALIITNGIRLEMVKIRAGSFIMGSPHEEFGHYSDEKQRRVTLSQDYWIGKFEVTQKQYELVMGSNPSCYKGENHPVEQVSWNDAVKFCAELNTLYAGKLPEGYHFSLPTEAQWEYACRAGTATAFNNGNLLTSEEAYFSDLGEISWYGEKGSSGHHEVGKKKPNAWELYDMHGNVFEWCLDWYGKYDGNTTDPYGAESGTFRVRRGGSWNGNAKFCRAAYRNRSRPDFRTNNTGFRAAIVPIR